IKEILDLHIDEEMEKHGISFGISELEAEEVVNFIIKYGVIHGASDIHLELDREGAQLRYRFDGVLKKCAIPWVNKKLKEILGAIVSRIKVMARLDIAEKRLPQDGVIRLTFRDPQTKAVFDLDFRVATCKGIIGENMVMRILDSRKANVGLDKLSHSVHVMEPFKKMLKSSAGMILVCGPTGSGKTSTLYAALQHINNPGVKIITAEDPIEYSLPGLMQTQTLHKIGLTFSRLLRSFLRLDPDVILVGETRDDETARIGFDAAQTGHLLLSTLHTNTAVGAITRLLDLNIERGQMAASLMGALAQRLVRRSCNNCKVRYTPGPEEWDIVFPSYPSHLPFYKGEGCKECGFSGYKGRVLISEIFVMNQDVAQALVKGAEEEEIRQIAVKAGMKTMLDDGLMKLEHTTLEELIRSVPFEVIKQFKREREAEAGIELHEAEVKAATDAHSDKTKRQTFKITDPKHEIASMRLIKDLYEQMKQQGGNSDYKVDWPLFKEFITDNFNKINKKYGCKSVIFNIEKAGSRVEIAAYPDIAH
ncbi:MAG: GspE/PulE family protein, partial [Pseudomonadota bacterium]